MGYSRVLILFASLYFVNADTVNNDCSVLTTYNPCGLEVIRFERVSEGNWLGVFNVDLFPRLNDVEIRIDFEKQVRITGGLQNSLVSVSNNWHGFVIKPLGQIPEEYSFYITLDGFTSNDTDVPTITLFSLNNVTLCDDAIRANQFKELLKIPDKNNKHENHICGRRVSETISINTEAKAGDWPWFAMLYYSNLTETPYGLITNGIIISHKAVITHAHILVDNNILTADKVIVVAGTNKGDYFDANWTRQSLAATDILVHPSYSKLSTKADLLIIKVNSFKYTAFVQPICLWGPVYEDKSNLIGQQGVTVANNNDVVLQSTIATVHNDTLCRKYLDVYVNEFSLCVGLAGLKLVDVYVTELMFPRIQADHKVSWFLRGVSSICSTKNGACDFQKYIVYADLAPHYSWIYHHSGL